MSATALKIVEISKKISGLSGRKLDEISDFVNFIASKDNKMGKNIARMEGIWKGKGFEHVNHEEELRTARRELSKAILKRKA